MQESILQVQKVKKKYGKFVALDGVSFEAAKGTHTLVLGPNGAGKTTLLKCIMGLVSFEGSITVNGFDVKKNAKKARALLGYVPQNYALYENLSVLEHARLGSRLKATSGDHIEEQLRRVDLWNVRKKKVRALSDGMKQRLGIALAMMGDPPVFLFDEPTSNVDLRGQLEFQGLLQELLRSGKTLMTTTHLSGMGEAASEVVILDRGKLLAKGSPHVLLDSMRANDILYIRVNASQLSDLAGFIRNIATAEVTTKGEWITLSVPLAAKVGLIQKILESGYKVEDLMVEHSRIESEYTKLIGDPNQA